MYIVDAKGMLVYMGGIDDKATADVADIKTARNHVLAALAEVGGGQAGVGAGHALLRLLGQI